MEYPLQYYLSCFGRMNCNKRKGETAPHKAVLLLAIIEEVRLSHITNGFVPLNDQMVAAFKREWRRYVGESELFNPVFETPFFHLDYEPFWELMKREPFKVMREYSLPRLRENFFGAKIPIVSNTDMARVSHWAGLSHKAVLDDSDYRKFNDLHVYFQDGQSEVYIGNMLNSMLNSY